MHWKSAGYEGGGKQRGTKESEVMPSGGGNDGTGMPAASRRRLRVRKQNCFF